VDQPVGLVLDAEGVTGVELVVSDALTNPARWSTTNCAAASVGGEMVFTTAGAGTASASLTGTFTAGTYKSSHRVSQMSGASVTRYIRGAVTGSTSSLSTVDANAASGNLNELVVFQMGAAGAGQTFTVNSLTVKEITGIHASQSTTPAKPILRRGAVNLLTYSQDFANAAWNANGTKSGSTLLTPTEGVQVSHSGTTAPSATTSTFSFVLSGSGTCSIYAYNGTNGFIGMQTVTLTSTPTIYASTITPTVAGTYVYFGRNTGETATSITFGGAALFQGTYTAAQIQALGGIPLTTTAPASTALGPYWWQFDGVDDSLALSGPLFQMSDDHWAVVAVRCDSSALNNHVFNAGNGATAQQVGSIKISSGLPTVTWHDGTLSTVLAGSVVTQSTWAVLSIRKVGSAVVLRQNGVQTASGSTASLGATTVMYAGVGAYFGGGGGPSLFLSGAIAHINCGKGTISDADLLTFERLVGNLSGVAIP
jgi:hypothetical protein